MEAEPSTSAPSCRDARVGCRSRRLASELLGHCAPYVRALGDGQPVESESLERMLSEALWHFETAVQENVTINGQLWQEATEDLQNETDIKLLEDRLDELIVEVASKRNQYPRKIQALVVKGIKTQQEMMDCYKPVWNSQDIKEEPSQDSRMADLRLVTKTVCTHIGESFKSVSSLIEKAESFSKAVSFQPALERCGLHQEIFSSSDVKDNKIEVKSLMAEVEVVPQETATSNSVRLKIKRSSGSPQKNYPLQRRKISLDT